MTAAVVIAFIVVVVMAFVLSKNNNTTEKKETPKQQKRNYAGVGVYSTEKISIELAGVHFRLDVFNEVKVNQLLMIRFDANNEYDKNAIGAYTKNGKLLGYIPRNQRKIIKTLRENPNAFGVIHAKRKNGSYISVIIWLWLGLSKEAYDLELSRYPF
jgi:hypothetical protein